MAKPMLVDSHCHLDFPDFADDLDGIVARAEAAGIGRMVTISTRVQASRRLAGDRRAVSRTSIARSAPIRITPTRKTTLPPAELIELHQASEGGGDRRGGAGYFYDNSSREAQERGFRAHIAAARATGLPLVIHTREADEDMRPHPRRGNRPRGRSPPCCIATPAGASWR